MGALRKLKVPPRHSSMPPKLCVSPISLPRGWRSAHTAAVLTNTNHVCSLFYLTTSVTHISTASAVPQELHLHTVPTHTCHPLSCSTNNPSAIRFFPGFTNSPCTFCIKCTAQPRSLLHMISSRIDSSCHGKTAGFLLMTTAPGSGTDPPAWDLVAGGLWWGRRETCFASTSATQEGWRLILLEAGTQHILQLYGP